MADDPALYMCRFRVAMGDTDAAQLIYFGAPLRWAERMLTGYLADSGTPTSRLLADGRGMPAVEAAIRFRTPLRLDDQVRGELRVQHHSKRAITWRCDFFHQDQTSSALDVVLTQVSVQLTEGTPAAVPLPDLLVEHLTKRTSSGENG